MADTLVDGVVAASLEIHHGFYGPFYDGTGTGVIVFLDDTIQIVHRRTTDSGATWSGPTTIHVAGAGLSCWYDQETPGDSGTLVHMTYVGDAAEEVLYRTLDVSDGSLGTEQTVVSLTVSTSATHQSSITKTVGGNLLIAFRGLSNERNVYRSTDSGANWTSRTTAWESSDDWILIFPANTADNQDVAAIFFDRSALAVSVKMYDDSANTWTETAIASSLNDTQMNFCAAIRHSDNHVVVTAWNAWDSATADLKSWDITVDSIASPTVTAKTDVVTDLNEAGWTSIHINQNNDDVRVMYIAGSALAATTKVVYRLSTDDMTTWGDEQVYSEDAEDDLRWIAYGRSTGSGGGRFQPAFFNDDLADIFINLTNDIEIAAAGAGGASQALSFLHRRSTRHILLR